ncbi:MAG: DUF1553 domain-containing protein, partial [Planctomycetota bacterium]
TGITPPVSATREFLKSEAPDKRNKLVDRLLESARHPTHLSNTWRRIMLPDGFASEMNGSAAGMQEWLRGRFAQNLRYDRMVGDFLTATGSSESGPALFYQALGAEPEKLAASTARIFLGLQLECAQCHDHPFDDWTQHEFWGYAAFFAQVRGSQQGRSFAISDSQSGEVKIPDEDEVVAPKFPKGDEPESSTDGTRRLQLSIWMSSPNNPFLAKATVNRVWSLMFGKGLVNPVDNLIPENDPIHPEVLSELSEFFVKSNYNLRELYRTIAYTDTYQLTSTSPTKEEGVKRREVFAQMHAKSMTAEQLYDSLQQALNMSANVSSSNVVAQPQRQTFVTQLDTKVEDATEYAAGIQQTLQLMNGRELAAGTLNPNVGLLGALAAPFFTSDDRIETLFLATLSRQPTEKEKSIFVSDGNDKLDSTDQADLLWALLNSAEFRFNH